MARALDGSSYVIGGIGSLVGIGNSGHTIVAICRRGANGAWHTPLSIETSANSSRLSMQFSNTNTIQLIIGSANKDTTVGITVSDDWVLAAVTRASGTSVPRGHKYVYGSNTWTHTDAGAASGGDSTDLTGGRIQIGRWQTTDIYNGDILLVAAWERALTDAEMEQLPFTLQALYASAPEALWLLDQAATTQTITDLTGNGANQTSLTGTTVSTNSVPLWSYGSGPSIGVGHAGGGAAEVTGTAAASLGGLTATATGTRTTAGTAAANLGALAGTAAGTPTTFGTAASTFGTLTGTASGVRTVLGTANANLGALTPSAAGLRQISGVCAAPLGVLAGTTIGGIATAGAANSALGALVATAAGTVRTPVAGTAVAALGALIGAATGNVGGADARATSTPVVTAGRTSTAAVTARRTSTSAVTTSRTSSSSIGG